MHFSAFYDILNGLYLDAEISSVREMDEKSDCVKLLDRSEVKKALLIADRGYENYNIFAHAIEKNWKFLNAGCGRYHLSRYPQAASIFFEEV